MGTCLKMEMKYVVGFIHEHDIHGYGMYVVRCAYCFDGYDVEVTWESPPARSGYPPLFSAPLVLAPLHSSPPEKWEGFEMNVSLQERCAQLSIQMLWHGSQSYRKLSQVAQLSNGFLKSVGEPDFLHKTLHFPRISFTSIMVCSWAWRVKIYTGWM